MFSVPDKEENRDNGGYLLYEKLLSFDSSSENASQLDPGLWYTAGIWRKRCGFCTLLEFVSILQEELIRAGVLPEDYDFAVRVL